MTRGILYVSTYQVSCPECGAFGEPCTDRETGDRVATHKARKEQARKVSARIAEGANA